MEHPDLKHPFIQNRARNYSTLTNKFEGRYSPTMMRLVNTKMKMQKMDFQQKLKNMRHKTTMENYDDEIKNA